MNPIFRFCTLFACGEAQNMELSKSSSLLLCCWDDFQFRFFIAPLVIPIQYERGFFFSAQGVGGGYYTTPETTTKWDYHRPSAGGANNNNNDNNDNSGGNGVGVGASVAAATPPSSSEEDGGLEDNNWEKDYKEIQNFQVRFKLLVLSNLFRWFFFIRPRRTRLRRRAATGPTR